MLEVIYFTFGQAERTISINRKTIRAIVVPNETAQIPIFPYSSLFLSRW